MLRLTEVLGAGAVEAGAWPSPAHTVTLTFADRRRSRLLARLDDGAEIALMLPRGTVLRDGDLLRAEGGGAVVRVRAAAEVLSVARTADALLLSRGAYHLGNRHVPLQLGAGWLAYEHDHVLDDLARALGLKVTTESLPFEPEAGGYSHQGTSPPSSRSAHAHDHDHHHGHGHAGGEHQPPGHDDEGHSGSFHTHGHGHRH